jgi:hypothetical protein
MTTNTVSLAALFFAGTMAAVLLVSPAMDSGDSVAEQQEVQTRKLGQRGTRGRLVTGTDAACDASAQPRRGQRPAFESRPAMIAGLGGDCPRRGTR